MVQRIENWSVLRGQVQAVSDDPQQPEFRRVSLAVDGVDTVDGFATAVSEDAAGSVVDIAVPRTTADAIGLAAGRVVELSARSTPAGLFAHPDRVRIVGGQVGVVPENST